MFWPGSEADIQGIRAGNVMCTQIMIGYNSRWFACNYCENRAKSGYYSYFINYNSVKQLEIWVNKL